MGSDGRQTVLREYVYGFPFRQAKKSNGSVNHAVHEADCHGSTGQTYCSQFKAQTNEVRTQVDVLNITKNLCDRCARRLDDHVVETMVAMANANTQRPIDVDDIQP